MCSFVPVAGGCLWKKGELALNGSEHFGTLQARKQFAFLGLFPIASSQTNYQANTLCIDPVHDKLCIMRHGIRHHCWACCSGEAHYSLPAYHHCGPSR